MWTLLLACGNGPSSSPAGAPLDPAVIAAIDLLQIRDDVERIAGDAVGGRVPGTPGHDEVRDYLASEMAAAGLVPAPGSSGFTQAIPLTGTRARFGLDAAGAVFEVPPVQTGSNLLGIRPGSDPARSEEVVLLVAHYDHLGVTADGEVFNGAFDDGAAVAGLLELARTLDRQGVALPRSVGFLLTDSEEDGLQGAAQWLAAPTLAVQDVVAVLSVDPIGRPLLFDYGPLFVTGAERSPQIAAALGAVAPYVSVEVRRISRAGIYGFASDQDVFWDAPDPIPALWISSPGMTFYHTVADDPETIDYASVRDHLAVIAQLAAALATDEARPKDLGPQVLSVDDLREAVATIDGALGSSELTDDERAIGEGFRQDLQRGIDANDASDPLLLVTYVSVLLYVVTDLAPAHPGPIPPPFPEVQR